MHKLDDVLDKYCERITKELGDLYTKISKSETLSAQDLDVMDKLLHSIKSNKAVIAMIEYDDGQGEDEGYSGKGYSGNGYSGKRYYNEQRRYDDGYSKRRSIPISGNGRMYSRDSERDDVVRKLESMMRNVRTEDEAMAIRDAIDTVNHMS